MIWLVLTGCFSAVSVIAALCAVEFSMLTIVSGYRIKAVEASMRNNPDEAARWWGKALRLHRRAWPLCLTRSERLVAAKLRAYLEETP